MLVENIPASVSVIEHYGGQAQPSPLGNGFFIWSDDGQAFLVTARHVLEIAEASWKATSAESRQGRPFIVLRVKSKENDRYQQWRIDLYGQDDSPVWLACAERRKDVAVIPLDSGQCSGFDIKLWTEKDLLNGSTLTMGDALIVFTHPANYGEPIPCDFPTTFQYTQNGDTGIIDKGLWPGNSGSLVYRSDSSGEGSPSAKLVGIFAGAMLDNPAVGYFYFIEILISIIHRSEECFDRSLLAWDEYMEAESIRWRKL